MKENTKGVRRDREAERGSANVKLAAILAVLFLIGHAGYNYIPVAYGGESFKQEMQTAVVNGTALPNTVDPVATTKARLLRVAAAENIPPNLVIEVKRVGTALQAHAAYSQQVNILPFGLYVYDYQFNHIATPTGFLMKE